MLVKPALGRAIRDPGTMQLVSETDGLEIDPSDLFWARVLGDGDVVEASATPAPKAAPVPPAPPASSGSTAPTNPEGSDA